TTQSSSGGDTPSGDNVINQSMTISRDANSNYVTVNNDQNSTGGWKVAKYNDKTNPGYLVIKLGKTASSITINNDGGKAIIMATELGSASPEYSNTAAAAVTMTNVPSGTYYIYNTSGNMTITDIAVTIDGSGSVTEDKIGDANYDGTVDNTDVQMVLDYASGKITSVTNAELADVSGNDTITAYDAYLIGKIILGLFN
ncbi:MAG: dockerin type I repeat-containing protein, partial [Lachnospirales bacterium]